MMIIRAIKKNDAKDFLSLLLKLDKETDFLLLEPEERIQDVEQLTKEIEVIQKKDNQNIFVAIENGELIGYIQGEGGQYSRNYYTVYLIMAIRKKLCNRGIGKELLTMLIDWAEKKGMHRLELTVMTHNLSAIKLYQKMGFNIEGIRRQCLKVNDQFIDEYNMGKILKKD